MAAVARLRHASPLDRARQQGGPMTLEFSEIQSPIGVLVTVAHDGTLCALEFGERWSRRRARLARRFGAVSFRCVEDAAGASARFAAYFGGGLHALAGLPVDAGGTPFQRWVWAALRRIPPGETISYQTLARRIGAPAAVRAVGAANGANPIGVVVPCHRVIGADASLTGFGGGLERKRWLLRHERTHTTSSVPYNLELRI